MLVSLTGGADDDPSTPALPPPAALVGGKAASLAKLYSTPGLSHHVPHAFALSTKFFRSWIDVIVQSEEYEAARSAFDSANGSGGGGVTSSVEELCAKLKEMCSELPLSSEQQSVVDALKTEMKSSWTVGHGLAAVRSSAPEEDGTGASFAGAFETRLGVSPDALERAVRACFASLFDYRVFSYTSTSNASGNNKLAFAAVVMEMIDSEVAGVAFSANPLNSDRDEMVLDSSWGLGESVVDGSVAADRYIFDRIGNKIVEKTIGKKTEEKRLLRNGGVDSMQVDEQRQMQNSLNDDQIMHLAKLVALVEKTYGMPMDVEWAFAKSSSSKELELKLLQARPITTLFCIDDNMMTKPGERRVLYYDFNIASEATTTTPFTHMDMTVYNKICGLFLGITDYNMFPYNPNMPMFSASTRQYCNLSIVFKYLTPEFCAKNSALLDPYLSAIFASKDCDRKRYRMKQLPKGVNLRNAWWILRQYPWIKSYKTANRFKKDPENQKEVYMKMVEEDMRKLKQAQEDGLDRSKGLQAFSDSLFEALMPSFNEELAILMFLVLPVLKGIDKKRRDGKTEQIRAEYDALCGGYVGDELMAMNIEMHKLATKLPAAIWTEYEHEELDKLAARIQDNLNGQKSDLPPEFLDEYNIFMNLYGFDGEDQMFLSSPRYDDNPQLLLGKLKQNCGAAVKDPADTQREQVAKRREVMKLHEERAKKNRHLHPRKLARVKKRNAYLENLLWIRNAPKIRIAKAIGIIRAEVLKVQEALLAANRLEEAGDIFHLELTEVDKALQDDSFDLMSIVTPRKAIHERALRATICPLLIDSRCRILKPDPPKLGEEHDEGTLIGAAVSPGVARGRVRIINSPNERFETGEVLATVVTGPAWTPLFVGASAVILQIGGVLQHGALCAREYGKPAVSNIDVHAELKTGQLVEVDGNTGIVCILPDEDDN